jgi:hypothetical protein
LVISSTFDSWRLQTLVIDDAEQPICSRVAYSTGSTGAADDCASCARQAAAETTARSPAAAQGNIMYAAGAARPASWATDSCCSAAIAAAPTGLNQDGSIQ